MSTTTRERTRLHAKEARARRTAPIVVVKRRPYRSASAVDVVRREPVLHAQPGPPTEAKG